MVQTLDHKEKSKKGMQEVQEAIPERGESRLCPNVHKPFEHCYCTSTSSLFAEATIYYCGGNYKECEIYLNHNKAIKGGGKA